MASLFTWKKKLKHAVNYPWQSDFNSDHPECPECGNIMDFYGHDESGDFPYGDGYWKCGNCGFTISEAAL
jgi:ribosomal protein S27AE